MQKIVTVQEMQTLEATADAQEMVSYAEMMAHAGAAVAEIAQDLLNHDRSTSVLVLVGKGNNGGDGLVAARILAAAGYATQVYATVAMSDVPLHQQAVAAGVFAVDAENDQRLRVLMNLTRGADLIIDALLGTGIQLPLRKPLRAILNTVRANLPTAAKYLAVDVATGVDLDTGAVDAAALAADVTVTFGAPKQGHFLFPAADYVGQLELAPIGWAAPFAALERIDCNLLTATTAKDLLPVRSRNSHKGTYGTVLAVAGSVNYAGAAYLAAAGAYRSGAGLVSVATPAAAYPVLASNLPEATWLMLSMTDGVISDSAVGIVQAALPSANALLLGPGWGTEATTRKFLRTLLTGAVTPKGKGALGFFKEDVAPAQSTKAALPPIVVDADGLKLLAEIENWTALLPDASVLTPHPGEMAVLTGLSTAEIQADRVRIAKQYAQAWQKIVVLKGAFTVIANAAGDVVVVPFATAALATAGTGDILAGLIAGYLAQGLLPFAAAQLAVYVHGLAGELASNTLENTDCVLAGDVLAHVSAAITALRQPQLPTQGRMTLYR